MVLPEQTKRTGGNVEVRYFGYSLSGFAICQEIMSSLPQIGGQRYKAAHRGNGTQEGTACNRPTGPEDQAQATAPQTAANKRTTGQPRPRTGHPPHPSPPQPFAGGHTFILKYPLSKIFCEKQSRQQIYLIPAY
jgi:hypothetical protein